MVQLYYRVWCPTHNEWEKDEITVINGIVYQHKNYGWIATPKHHADFKMEKYDIYHNDIIEHQGQRYIVIYGENNDYRKFRFQWVKNRKIIFRACEDFGTIDLTQAKVIGNIYENSELLEVR